MAPPPTPEVLIIFSTDDPRSPPHDLAALRRHDLPHPRRRSRPVGAFAHARRHRLHACLRPLRACPLRRLRRPQAYRRLLRRLRRRLVPDGRARRPDRPHLRRLPLQRHARRKHRPRPRHHPAGLVHDDLPLMDGRPRPAARHRHRHHSWASPRSPPSRPSS